MTIINIGTATPTHAITLEDRFDIANNYVVGNQDERMFTAYIMEKSTVERRHLAILKTDYGAINDRQNLFPAIENGLETKGPTTAQRIIAYENHATELAKVAVSKTFLDSTIKPADVTHTVTASCTGFSAPGVDIDLIREFSLSPATQRTHIGFMGCHAGLNALRVAQALANSDPDACVLVAVVELCGLHYQYIGENDQKVANALFADGAASALVLGANKAKLIPADSWKIAATGSVILADSEDCMTWKVRDHGFIMSLSERIPMLIQDNLRKWMTQWLQLNKLEIKDIATWAVHPGGPQILNAFERAMKPHNYGVKYSREILKENGNMSSATIFFILQRIMNSNEKTPCVALGFGPGLTVEATLFQ